MFHGHFWADFRLASNNVIWRTEIGNVLLNLKLSLTFIDGSTVFGLYQWVHLNHLT